MGHPVLWSQGSISISTHSEGDGHEELPEDEDENEPSVRGKVAEDRRKDERKILWDEDDGRSIVRGRHCEDSGGSSRKREDDI